MQLVTLDFETYYDKEYTLKKMTTEEYVRDSRFKVHCVGLKSPDSPAARIVNLEYAKEDGIEKYAILCHHAHFDGLILSHHYGVRPAMWFDTLSMARLALPHLKSHSLESLATHFGLPAKTVPYNLFIGQRDLSADVQRQLEEGCKHDVELTYAIFQKLLPLVSKEELRVIDLTIRMFTEPALQLDRERMNVYLAQTIKDKETLLERCGVTSSDLASSAKFAAILTSLGVEPPVKTSIKTGKETYALAKTDAAFKELCESDNETVAALCAARLGIKSTLAETRAGRLIAASTRGALPVYLKYYGAHTGRWSGGDKVNWQNFPRGGEIRKSIMAPAGHVLVVMDLSQIECRMVNWLAGQEDVLDAFRAGRDVYCESATRFYGRTITKADKAERQIFKSVELGCGYGMGAKKFRTYAAQTGSKIDEAQADELIKFYRHTHENVCHYWRRMDKKLQDMAISGNARIDYPNGAYQIFTDLKRGDDRNFIYTLRGREQKIYGALLVENVTQALSRILLSQAMLKISERYKIVMSTHDEVVYLAPITDAEEAYQFGLKVFTTPPDWCKTIPLAAEGGYDVRYSK